MGTRDIVGAVELVIFLGFFCAWGEAILFYGSRVAKNCVMRRIASVLLASYAVVEVNIFLPSWVSKGCMAMVMLSAYVTVSYVFLAVILFRRVSPSSAIKR